MAEQERWDEHASFMNKLVTDGFIILGGPVGEGENILLVVRAGSKDDIYGRLAADPWTPMNLLRVSSIEHWHIQLGEGPGS
jgi:hypothetical protein